MEQRIDRVRAPGGEEIAVGSVGAGPPVLLAAWWTSHLELDWANESFRSFVETLAQRHRVLRYDRPGVGLSERTERPYDLDAETTYLRAVAEAAAPDEPLDVMGISCGGPAAIRFAAESPERVRSLLLFGSYVEGARIVDEATRRALVDLTRANWGLGSQTLANLMLAGATPTATRRFSRTQRDTATADVAADLLALTFDLDASPWVADVDAPTLVLHRTHDRVVGAELGRDLAARIPGARIAELEGRAHIPWSDDPSSALEEIGRFLDGTAVSAPSTRRLGTVVFVDVVASTETLARIGDARWGHRLDQLAGIIDEEVTAGGGTIVKDTGDGALLRIELPSTAVEVCESVRRRARKIGLGVRCGIHTGEIEARGDDVTGVAVVAAARVADLAADGEILVTRSVADMAAGRGTAFADRGRHRLKGLDGEWELFAAGAVEGQEAPTTAEAAVEPGGRPVWRFGDCELDVEAFELRRAGEAVSVEPQVLEVLWFLVERAGQLVTKEELLDGVWGDRFVSESALTSRIRSVRRAVGDDGRRQEVVRTVHRRGYRFVAEVEVMGSRGSSE